MSESCLHYGPFEIDEARGLVRKDGALVYQGDRATTLFATLVRRVGELVPKAELIAAVWPNLTVEEANLRVQISELRKLLDDKASGETCLVTVVGRGYRLLPAHPQITDKPPERYHAPAPESALIGREAVMSDLCARLERPGLVTLSGPGGIGKTAVAIAFAHHPSVARQKEVYFVDLVNARDATTLQSAVVGALGLAVTSEDYLAQIVTFFANRSALLILDTCEHVLDAAARFCELTGAMLPDLRLLATSREPLRTRAEVCLRLDPLTDDDTLTLLRQRLGSERPESKRLGAESLANVQTHPDLPALCASLDGCPLVIEMAAARIAVLGVDEVLKRMESRFSFLGASWRTQAPRQQTLQATFDWSFDLLDPAERRVATALGLFSGPVPLEALESLLGAFVENRLLIDLLEDLRSKSWLVTSHIQDRISYTLQHSARDYLRDKLRQDDRYDELAHAYLTYLTALFKGLDQACATTRTYKAYWACDGLFEDVCAMIDWGFLNGHSGLAHRLTAFAAPLWRERGLLVEQRHYVERALRTRPEETTGDAEEGARADMLLKTALAFACFHVENAPHQSPGLFDTALEAATRQNDIASQMRILWGQAANRKLQGQYEEVLHIASRYERLAARLPAPEAAQITGLRISSMALHYLGRHAEAVARTQKLIALAPASLPTESSFDCDDLAIALCHTARSLWLMGRGREAEAMMMRSLFEAQRSRSDVTRTYVLAFGACTLALWNGAWESLSSHTQSLVNLVRNLGSAYWMSWARCYEAALQARQSGVAPDIDALAITPLHADILATFGPDFMSGLARQRGLARTNIWALPEVLRRLATTERDSRPAQTRLVEAWYIAQAQGARAWQLRIACSLWEAAVSDDERALAWRRLTAIHAMLNDEHTGADLIRAQDILRRGAPICQETRIDLAG